MDIFPFEEPLVQTVKITKQNIRVNQNFLILCAMKLLRFSCGGKCEDKCIRSVVSVCKIIASDIDTVLGNYSHIYDVND